MAVQELISQVSESSSDVLPRPTSSTKSSAHLVEIDLQSRSRNLDSEESALRNIRQDSSSSAEESKSLKNLSPKSLKNSTSSVECVANNETDGIITRSDAESRSMIDLRNDLQVHHPQNLKEKNSHYEEHLQKKDANNSLQTLSEGISSVRLNSIPETSTSRSASIAFLATYKDTQVVEPGILESALNRESRVISEIDKRNKTDVFGKELNYNGNSKENDQNTLNKTQSIPKTSKLLLLNEDETNNFDNRQNFPNEDQSRQNGSRNDSHSQNISVGEAPPLPQRVSHDSLQQLQSAVSNPPPENRSQRKEMYDIKKIKWCDEKSKGVSKTSPILIQNANGPCPLLGLVNALTLSTPAGLNTPLIETLRTREQVSLGLLLDAVFDEITSGRHGNAADELPDVTDLYSFLVSLHTGMNVNPKFFPADSGYCDKGSIPEKKLWNEKDLTGLFEETREVRLYSTFRVSLIHGWLPQPNSPEYTALLRSAKTYEDAQNILLMQEALEIKLSDKGLCLEEQILLEDISTIRAFFESHATQLTPYGLECIGTSLSPGNFAILFRNNHFSTLYRHPKTLQLLQLVTDMGYSKNNEVIWESLSDVTGEYTQFYSGDLRLVSDVSIGSVCNQQNYCSSQNSQQPSQLSSHERGTDIQTQLSQTQKIEQEDHDLAIAIQLQEEEEQRHKSTLRVRRRTTDTSHPQDAQAISRGGQIEENINRSLNIDTSGVRAKNGPVIPPRRSLMNIRSQPINLNVETDHPPPSYEVAATQKAYIPSDISHFDTLSSSYNPHSLPRPSQNLINNEVSRRNDRRDQPLSSRSGLKNERRPGPVQGVVDKVVGGQGRAQKECTVM